MKSCHSRKRNVRLKFPSLFSIITVVAYANHRFAELVSGDVSERIKFYITDMSMAAWVFIIHSMVPTIPLAERGYECDML